MHPRGRGRGRGAKRARSPHAMAMEPDGAEGMSCGLKPGPLNCQEVFDWPADLTRRSVTVGEGDLFRQCRLRSMVDGVQWAVSSDYAGYDCPREALRLGHEALRRQFPAWELLPIRHLRACDIDALQQDILKQISLTVDDSKSCVFGDLNDRLGADSVALLDTMEPCSKATRKVKVEKRLEQCEWIRAHKSTLFTAASTSACLVHGKECPTFPLAVESSPEIGIDADASTCSGADGDPEAARRLFQRGAPPDDPPRKRRVLRFNIAGTCCQGWSMEGQLARFSHPSERPHAIWQAEREEAAAKELEDAFFQECTPGYRWKQKLQEPLRDTHTVVRLKVSPRMLGYPSNRDRSYVFG